MRDGQGIVAPVDDSRFLVNQRLGNRCSQLLLQVLPDGLSSATKTVSNLSPPISSAVILATAPTLKGHTQCRNDSAGTAILSFLGITEVLGLTFCPLTPRTWGSVNDGGPFMAGVE